MKRWFTTLLLVTLSCPVLVYGQGVTTSSMRGTVTDEAGEPLPGANVLAVHLPTGSEYGAATGVQGTFNLRNLRVGGPYRVRVTFVGFEPFVREDINLVLGETYVLNPELSQAAAELEEVTVTAAGTFDSERTGVATTIDDEAINSTPNVGRDLADFVRLTPQAYVANDDDDGPAISIAGQNNRYNSIFIDGAVSNDVFGLSAQGTDGGQTGSTPISIDAIEQFQVNLSPYDVTQSGFTGGAINAVTRSGSNQFEGSVYYFLRDEALAGRTPTADPDVERELLSNFSNERYGLRLGGPILEDRLFFFVNGELLRSETPQPFAEAYTGATPVDQLSQLEAALADVGYNPGDFGDKNSALDSDKLLVKLDWNVSQNHKLSLRNNYAQSDNVDAFASGATSINYTNSNEVFPNETNTTVLELNSTFGSAFANRFIASYKIVRDDRGIAGDPFPFVTIEDGDGDIDIGPEQFSTANVLDQNVFNVTNDFNWFLGRHTFTIGANFEYYDISNLFIPRNFGFYQYEDLDDSGTGLDEFLESVCAAAAQEGNADSEVCQQFGPNPEFAPPARFRRSFSLVDDDPSTPEFEDVAGDNSDAVGAFEALQFGVYVQDAFQLNERLRLTGGLRLDIPALTTDPNAAPGAPATLDQVAEFYDLNGAAAGQTFGAQLLFSPRLGFNYDVFGDQRTQVRGGAGIFTGRVPFVWAGSVYLNNGTNTGALDEFSGTLNDLDPATTDPVIPFIPNPQNALNGEDFERSLIPSGRLELFEENFTFPRVFRTSLGVDHQLPYGIIGTLEGQFTKTLSNIEVTNINLRNDAETLRTLDGPDDRPIYARTIDPGSNEIVVDDNLIDPAYSAIQRIGDTSEGYTYDLTAQLRKEFRDEEIPFFNSLLASASYTYGDAFSVNDGTSSQVNSLWAFTPFIDGPNDLELARSDFSLGHRVTASLAFRRGGTRISAFLTGESGRPFSYVIDNSAEMIGAPGVGDVALFYVPEAISFGSPSEIDPAAYGLAFDGTLEEQQQQIAELEEFIRGNDYLSERRGRYAERNGDRAPFETILDLQIAQEVFGDLSGLGRLEVTLDIFNLTNLIDPDWGRRYNVGFGDYNVVEFEGFRDALGGDFTPLYSLDFDEEINGEDDIFEQEIVQAGTTYSARWQMQLGVRLTF